MFSSRSFAPLYAEQALSVEVGQQRYQLKTANVAKSSSAVLGYYSYDQSPLCEAHEHGDPNLGRTRSNWHASGGDIPNDISPTSTQTTSSTVDDDLFALEVPFEDEPYARRMESSSISSSKQRLVASPSIQGSSRTNSSSSSSNRSFSRYTSRCSVQQATHRQTLEDPPAEELASGDHQIQKLMNKLDKMQRRVTELRVDRQCQDLKFAINTEAALSDLDEGNSTQPVGLENGGPLHGNGDRSGSITSEDEKQQEGRKKHPHIGPGANRLISKLLHDYEDMERLYKEEKFQHARHMRNISLQKAFGGTSVVADRDGMSQSSTHVDPARCDTRSDLGVFMPRPQEEMRFSHITHPNITGLSWGAPDPPEMQQPQLEQRCIKTKYSPFDGQTKQDGDGDEDDHHSDDLSSRQVNNLIDEDVSSDCKAVKEHQSDGRQYWRDIILGVNDGLVSTFLLVAGVHGGGMSSKDILLTAIAGSVAGAVSMCAGEYVATKSQNEVIAGEIALEERHIREHRRDELMEVRNLLELIGIGADDRSLQKRLIRHYARDSKALLKVMVALELGFLAAEERSPIMAGFVSFFVFLIGAAPSVIPFTVPGIEPTTGFIAAGIATCITLVLVGAVKTWATKGNCWTAALENLCVAGLGGAVAFGAGILVQEIIQA
jgi:vacuolar iron transporter family protein